MSKLVEEHAFEGVELGFLLLAKVIEVRVIDDIKAIVEFIFVGVMAFGLLSELEEGFLNLNIRKGIDLAKLVDADFRKIMLACNMSKTVNDPSSLMVAAVRIRVIRRIGLVGRDQAEIDIIDHVEDVLAPSHKVLPRINIIPEVW